MSEQTFNSLKMHAEDNVVIALRNLRAGEALSVQGGSTNVQVQQNIPFGHKIATDFIPKGQSVLKYGEWLGIATEDIAIGHHVHVHNVRGLNEQERYDARSGKERSKI
ncbi:altronate dehydratase [Geomicrobium halophilum]|uniref:Altronate dehydratase n=1 Tax=Geomicrobium halophilum TaxID=549000 RepID=A0A841PIJ5_9BACL|nr:UxaA family hydrolase [Geomicrobium halophilum]MBB6448620.1 altronate dehydratase [Geomicrobium halophilum]